MARTTINSLGVPAGTITATDLSYPLTTFSSTGIDDNATSTAITIDSSDRVGIGITPINANLEVAGTGTTSEDVIHWSNSSGVNKGMLQLSSTGGGQLQLRDAGNTVDVQISSTTDSYFNGGNVGIGTTSPGGILHLRSDDNGMVFQSSSSANSRAQIFFQNTGGTTTGKIAVDPDGGNANVMAFSTGATERMRIDSNGQTMLAGSTSAFDNTGAVNGLQLHYTTTTGKGVIGTYSSGGSTSLAFRTNSGGAGAATDHMIIDTNGNVGIGTSSINSSYRLNVEGAIIPILAKSSSTVTSSMYACVATARPLNVVGNGSGYGMNMNNSSGSMAEYGYIGGLIENNTASSHSGALIFAPTSSGTRTERMRISSSGNVGIGTTGPNYSLDVVGAIRATNSGGSTIIANRTSNPGSFELQYDGTQTAQFSALSGGGVVTYTGSTPTERMRIDSAGDVGIGIAPVSGYGRKLQVHSAAGGGASVHITDSSTGSTASDGLELITFASAAYIWNREASFMSFGTSATERMRIDSAGNVGINQSAPDAQLTLNPPNYTSTATGGMIKWKNSNNSGHSNIQSYFVSGQGTDINIGANAYINTSGAWSRWSTGLATSAIACRRDGNINFVTNSSSGNGITRAAINTDGQLLINRSTSITTGVASKLCITGNIDIDGNPGSTNVIRLHQSATEMGQVYGHTTGLRFYNFTGGVTSIKAQSDATLRLIPGAGGNDAQIQLTGNAENIATEGFEIWYDNDVGDVHLNTTYGSDVAAIRFHTRVGASKSTANERLTITGGGDVGISATSPSAIISSSRILQVASGGNTTLSVTSTDSVNDRSAILELLSSGNGGSKSIILYGDTDTTPGTPSPLVFQGYHSGARTERMRILPTGGIAFNGDTATANALDDYEEGTYTPIYYGSSTGNTGTTYTANTGVYTKIGRTVTVWIDMTISAQSGNTGTPMISLPFMSGTGYGTDSAGQTRYDMGAFMPWQTSDNFTGTRRPTGWITNNSGVMQMYGYTTAGVGGLTAWTLNTTGRISGKIIYTAAF